MVKKCWIKNGTEVTLNLSSNVVGDTNDETNWHINHHELIDKLWGFGDLLEMVYQLI